MAVRR